MATPPLTIHLPRPLTLGLTGTILLAIASFSGGATRNRGGLLEALNLSFLAYGHGRNLGMALFWVGIFCLVGAWILLGRETVAPAREGALATVRRTLTWWLAPLLVAAPLASRDVYSYLMQGAMVRDGFDPYSEGPVVNPGPFLLEVSQDWRNTTTPYGPLHLWIGEGVTSLVGDNVAVGIFVYKLISLAGFAAIAWSVPRIAWELGGSPTMALWLGVANPVMLLHLVAGMHNESVMVGLVSVGLLLALRRKFLSGLALIAAAVALKATAFIAMPFVVWIMVHHFAPRATSSAAKRFGVFVAAGTVMVLETVAVVAVITWAPGSSWGWLSEITGNAKVINPLAGPTLVSDVVAPLVQIFNPDISYNSVLSIMRTLSMLLMLLGLILVWWISRRSIRDAVLGTAGAYQVAFIFNSVTLPWYYASVISLVGVAQPPMWVIKLATGASVFVAVSFSSDGNHQLYNWWWVIGSIIVSWLAAEWVFPARPRRELSSGSRAAV